MCCYCDPDEKTLADLLAKEDGDPYEPLTREQRHAVAERYISEVRAWAEAPLPEPKPMTPFQRESRKVMRDLYARMVKKMLDDSEKMSKLLALGETPIESGKTFTVKVK